MHTAHINIGSNIGDRHSNLRRAVASIIHSPWTHSATLSDIIESPPWGYQSPNPYLNQGIQIRTPLKPIQLHQHLQRLQHTISTAPHRTHAGIYADRIIDIDLIAIDNITLSTPSLTLPHPRMHQRRFVLQPMAQLWPEWKHPELNLTAAQMLEAIDRYVTE